MTPTELTTAREALHLSQVELARVLGVAVNTVNRWEHGGRAIPPYLGWTLRGIAAYEDPDELRVRRIADQVRQLIDAHPNRGVPADHWSLNLPPR